MARPTLIDLYCGEGGASMGYHRAGFHVIGVDANPKVGNRYPFTFHHGNALELLPRLIERYRPDALAGSPPRKSETPLRHLQDKNYVDWITPTLAAFEQTGLPWVIENVAATDKLPGALVLCGTEFNLRAEGRWLRRHRRFASNVWLWPAGGCRCHGKPIGGVYGDGGTGQMTRGYKFHPDAARTAMGIDWMSRSGLSQAIPPAYTQFIGEQLLAAISATATAA